MTVRKALWLSALAAVAGLFTPSSPADAQKPRFTSSRIELGRRLFMDPTVSRAARFSCASCHDPEHGFSDARVLSVDETGETLRHSQPLLDLEDGAGMHWDGEFFQVRELLIARLAPGAEAQSQAVDLAQRHFAAARRRGEADTEAFQNRVNTLRPPSWAPRTSTPITLAGPVARRLDEEGRYANGFRRAFGSPRVTTERLVDAMEAYVLSLRSGRSPYDRFARGDEHALTPAARRGLELFKGKADCASCHTLDRFRARFTDDRFHNTGVAFASGEDLDDGRRSRSFVAADHARFKTPTLRDVARRPPYMHDGSLATLHDVVRYYDRGGTPNDGLDPHIRPLGLTEGEVEELVAFLESLTSEDRPGLGPTARHRAKETRVRIECLEGEPVAGLKVRVVPFGDRLAGEGAGTVECETDRQGWIRFRFPDWTHVRLEAEGYSLGEGAPLPDYVRRAELIAAPRGTTAFRVIAGRIGPLPEVLTAEGETFGEVAFTKVRDLGRREALYLALRDLSGSDVLTFRDLPRGAVSRRYGIEYGQGFSAAVDVRPDPGGPPPRPPSVQIRPSKAKQAGGREAASEERQADRGRR